MDNDRILLTNSMLSTFKLCHMKAWFKYHHRLEPKHSGLALYRGSAVHAFLEKIYGEGIDDPRILSQHAASAYRRMVDEAAPYMSQADIDRSRKDLTLVAGLPYGYVEVYGDDLKNYEVLGVEKRIRTRIIHPDTGELHPYCDYGMTLDFLVRDRRDGRTMLMEHKTTSRMDDLYFKKLEIDPQITGYQIGCASIGHPIDCIIYNVMQMPGIRQRKNETPNEYYKRLTDLLVEESDKYFHRDVIQLSDTQIRRFMLGLWQWADVVADLMVHKKGEWLKSNVVACTYFNRICEFFEPCTHGMEGPHMLNYDVRSNLHPEYEKES